MAASPRDIVIFGLEEVASLAWYVFTHDSDYRVVAFTVDGAYAKHAHLHGLPVVPFERLHETFPPDRYAMHLPIGWKGMNTLRARKLAQAREMGYPIVSYVSRRANVWPDLRLGENCQIHQTTSIGPFVEIGDDCMIFGSVTIGHHTVIGKHCYVAGRASISGGVVIGDNCVIGANCTITDGVRIAPRCFIGAGAIITRDTVENGVYTGMPGKLRKVPAERVPRVL